MRLLRRIAAVLLLSIGLVPHLGGSAIVSCCQHEVVPTDCGAMPEMQNAPSCAVCSAAPAAPITQVPLPALKLWRAATLASIPQASPAAPEWSTSSAVDLANRPTLERLRVLLI